MAHSSIRRLTFVLVVVADVNHHSAESLIVATTPCRVGRLHRRLHTDALLYRAGGDTSALFLQHHAPTTSIIAMNRRKKNDRILVS
jgi:hypothetical protein